ncbi:MAG: hypothetical protein R3B90_22875 [Planctomycetaceae bacterium]
MDELELWDKQTARLFAIKHEECRTEKRIVLVGAVDLNQAVRRMLDQVAERVTACIHAPESQADWFDEHGCLVPDRWSAAPIDLETGQIHVVQGPLEQAAEVCYQLADLGGKYRPDEIVIGAADEAAGSPPGGTTLRMRRRHPARGPDAARADRTGASAGRRRRLHRRQSQQPVRGNHAAPRSRTLDSRARSSPWWHSQLDTYLADHLQPRWATGSAMPTSAIGFARWSN